MSTDSDAPTDGLSRREALKRGFKLTGAVLWATPVLQVVNMSPAAAEATSGPVVVASKICYAVKIHKVSGKACCVDISNQVRTNNHGKCLDVDDFDQAPVSGGCRLVKWFRTPTSGAWKVVLVEGLDLEEVSGFSYVKSHNKRGFCVSNLVYDEAKRTLTFTPPRRKKISNVQFFFCITVEGGIND